jgi:carbamoyl-phosphate synthase large subunit
MPRRNDISKILVIGSGPIVIGQASEFDYSGTQALKALKEEGYTVVLVNSNPATIMTDPEFADRTYIEPLTTEVVEDILRVEKVDAILPTMGGQTALNLVLALEEKGVLERYEVKLLGANLESIKKAEDRELFKQAMDKIGLKSAESRLVRSLEDAAGAAKELSYPLILRPSRTLGGTGGGIVANEAELKIKVQQALTASPNHEVLVEKSLLGWKEIELEVMRDRNDNVVIVCGIENFDPMGVHTGDSITVAPVQTLTDKEYQELRDAAIKVIREIGVETGGSNVQFAINPENGEIIIIEMNPRVSRSSALASKATGFPIAKIAAKLAVGYTLDELTNDITKETPACFEPSIDYVVVKIPRFNFEKFPLADSSLGTQMKSVGEVLAFGRSFAEALQKAICSLELDSYGFDLKVDSAHFSLEDLLQECSRASDKRLWYLAEALRRGASCKLVASRSGVDIWFLSEIAGIINCENEIAGKELEEISASRLFELKNLGFSDVRLAKLLNTTETAVYQKRKVNGITASYKSVDTCAAEFEAKTPYFYSTFESSGESVERIKPRIIILGSGPNRIGQGIEFDYCCVHAVLALRADGYEAVMINCNPETVSTDYDISDRLYFEPLTFESVMSIVDQEKPVGVIVQFGGQTPLKLAAQLEKAGVPIIGTSVESIDLAEDREKFSRLVTQLGLRQPSFATARSLEEAEQVADQLGFPVMIRPSFVLGGRAMRIVYSMEELIGFMRESVEVSNSRPVLLDRYLHNAIELDVDAVGDGKECVVAAVMEHIERAGIHSGDSSCCLPPQTLSVETIEELKMQTRHFASALNVKGLMNVQYAVTSNGEIYVLEVNPRASRTVPFVSKATGTPWAKIAASIMAGKSISELKVLEPSGLKHVSVKASVFPYNKFSGVDILLGPEMKSTGEVMGVHGSFSAAFAKSQLAVNTRIPLEGKVFLSVMDSHKVELIDVAQSLLKMGFSLVATAGTCAYLREQGFEVQRINKVREGSPHIVDALSREEIALVINTPEGTGPLLDSRSIRLVANEFKVPTFTTMAAAIAVVNAIRILKENKVLGTNALQDFSTS